MNLFVVPVLYLRFGRGAGSGTPSGGVRRDVASAPDAGEPAPVAPRARESVALLLRRTWAMWFDGVEPRRQSSG
jgi:hypothetical protein